MRLGKKWPKYEAVSQSLPPQTPIADESGRAVKECSSYSTPQCPQGDETSSSTPKAMMSGLSFKDTEHPNSGRDHKRTLAYVTKVSFLTVSLDNFKPHSAI